MPKGFPLAIKARAIGLLAEGKNATEAAECLGLENPGMSIDPSTVSAWARALKIHIPRGRAPGSAPTRFSPNRDAIVACHAEGLTQAQTCARLGLSRSLVSKHWPDPAEPNP